MAFLLALGPASFGHRAGPDMPARGTKFSFFPLEGFSAHAADNYLAPLLFNQRPLHHSRWKRIILLTAHITRPDRHTMPYLRFWWKI
jgi:hypothetical protein